MNYFDKQHFLTVTNECWFLLYYHWIEMIPEHEKPNRKIWRKFPNWIMNFYSFTANQTFGSLFRVTVLSSIVKCSKRIRLIHWLVPRWTAELSWSGVCVCLSERMPFFGWMKWMLNTISIFIIDNIVISDFHWLQISIAHSFLLWPLFKNSFFFIILLILQFKFQ